MFKTTKQFNEIKALLKEHNLLNADANFVCTYDSDTFYEVLIGNYSHEFAFETDDYCSKKMDVLELINMPKLKYFKYTIYEQVDGRQNIISQLGWSIDLNQN